MPSKQIIRTYEATTPIREPVTKFGGQPVWLTEPTWPLSRETGKPMRFIGQFEIREEFGLQTDARMAYLFMTEDIEEYVDGTYEPDSGENAVILQATPGLTASTMKNPAVATAPNSEGPPLFRMVKVAGEKGLHPELCEFSVDLTQADDVVFVPDTELFKLSDEESEKLTSVLNENKIGGTPAFLQGDEFPFEDGCQLLLQLDS
jgi:uncharacterized protein YwqG